MACLVKIIDGEPKGWASGSIDDCLASLSPQISDDDKEIVRVITEMKSVSRDIRLGKYEIIKGVWLLVG